MKTFSKKILSVVLAFIMGISMINFDMITAYAAQNITIKNFDYIQTNDRGNTSVRVVIEGTGFRQILTPGEEPVSVISDIRVRSGAETKSLMQGEAVRQGVKVEISDSLITINAPKTGDFTTLNINTGGINTISIDTRGDMPTKSYSFDAKINELPSMPGSLKNSKIYVGESLDITGSNFIGVTDVVIAGASHEESTGDMTIVDGNNIKINNLKKNTLNRMQPIQFIKEDTTSNQSSSISPVIKFTAEYTDKVFVFEKLPGMDNLRVLPSEGPHATPSKITVQALDENDQLMYDIFKMGYKIVLRREVSDSQGNIKENVIRLTDIRLVYEIPEDETSPIVAIEGWTPPGTHPANTTWDVVIQDPTNASSEGIKRQAYTFVTSNPAPQILGISPAEGPDTGGTDVLLTGKNFLTVNTPGIRIPNDVKVLPASDATTIGTETFNVDYAVPAGVTYGGEKVADINRKIRVRIASLTNVNAGTIYQLASPPKPGDEQGGKPYGKFHFMADGTDGVVVTTTNAATSGPQTIIMDIETTFTFEDGTSITIPEGTKYSSFTYTEKNPTPIVENLEIEYGFFNDSKEEDNPSGVDDGVKPLMVRITGQKFEAIKEGEIMHFPTVQFVMPDLTTIPAISSTDIDDTRILDDKGNPIDGVYNKVGTTLVMSIIPPRNDKYGLRRLIGTEQEQPGNYKNLDAIIQVTNPSGNSNSPNTDGVKFQFRRPTETSFTDINSKQPEITSVLRNGAPVAKLPSDQDTEVEIRVKAVAGITNMDALKVTVDGKDISSGIKETKFEGDEVVMKVTIPKGFVGRTRLQVIIPEGLMDSKQIIFDTVRGPEIKELIPDRGDKGTIVVIKRDDQANEVGFKVPLPNSASEMERIGSKVLWNGQDINEVFKGYEKDGSGNVIYQQSDTFLNFKQKNKEDDATPVEIPGKYVYVVDADTIYLKIPENENLKEAEYKIQIKNPDGSESSVAASFIIIDTIDKTIIGSIEPNKDDVKGGIITTITAGVDSSGGQTNFKGEIDVWFGSQKAEVVGYDLEYKEAYVKVPPLVDFVFPTTLTDEVEAFTVPVTVQNKVNKSTDTVNDGFKYLNPTYSMKITQVYNEKYSTDPTNANASHGVEGDILVIRGENFRLQYDSDSEKYILPNVMFGYKLSEVPVDYGAKNEDSSGKPILDGEGRAELEWIKVKVPERPFNVGADGAVDLLVQNPDGAKTIKEGGFTYISSKPQIIEESSILQASRFFDTITVNARDVNPEGLAVAFGNKIYEKEMASSQMEIETTEEVEKIVIRYIPSSGDNMEIFYKSPDGKLIPMTDSTNTNNGKFRLGKVGDKKIIGINWKNPAYHSTDITKNPTLVNSLNKEYIQVHIENKAPNINAMVVRRGLGEITNAVLDPVSQTTKLTINTPFWEKVEETTITVINADGSSDDAPFNFHGGLQGPEITDIDGSKPRDLTIEGKNVKANVYTSDFTEENEITIIGKNFKDIKRLLIGDYDAEVINASQDYTRVKVRVPKGKLDDVGKPLPVTVVTQEGNAISDQSIPPVYYMFIQAGSKPKISKITPMRGPQTGGTKITIEGTDFSEMDEFGVKGEIEVYMGGVKAKVDRLIRNEKGEIISLEATTPPVEMIEEQTSVQVKNADGGRGEPAKFNYISQPVIEKVEGQIRFNAQEDPDGNKVQVKVYGKNFYNPQYVIIGGEIVKIDRNKDNDDEFLMLGVKSDGSNQYVELGKNKDGTTKGKQLDITVGENITNNQNGRVDYFTVTIPVISVEDMDNIYKQNMIVVNGDGGISPETPVDIKLPIPEAPAIIATPGYNNTINIAWHLKEKDLNKADRFEIYVKPEGANNDYMHVGDVPKNQDGSLDYYYIIKNTTPNTQYQIKVRVMNAYGEAEDFGYAKIKTLAKEDDYKQQEKEKEYTRAQDTLRQQGSQKVVGNRLEYTVGTFENNIPIAGYPNVTEKQIRIPVAQIKLSQDTVIQINDTNMNLTVPFKAFNIPQVTQASDDSVVAITIRNGDNKVDEKVSTLARGLGSKRMIRVHRIDFELIEPKRKTPIYRTLSPVILNLYTNSYNNSMGNFTQYDPNANRLNKSVNNNISSGGYYVLLEN